jgi:predicted nucleic acid-binding protein
MLIDTDVLIFYSRGSSKAQKALGELDTIYLSVVSYMEFLQGVKNKQELREFEKYLK